MAEGLNEGASPMTDDGAVSARVPATQSRSESKRGREREASSPHAGRFRFFTALLVGVGIGALIIAGALAHTGRKGAASGGQPWSSWSPPDGGTLGARDIADYVAPFYRLSATSQLAIVTVVNLESAAAASAQAQAEAEGTTSTTPSSGLQVAVRPSPTSSAVSLLSGNTIAYDLCGQSSTNNCTIAGQPSTNRLLLLRREALELALYTFKYVSSTENVVAILPPGRTEETGTSTLSKHLPTSDASATSKPIDIAVLFERQEVQPLLTHPLSASLPEEIPPTVDEMPKAPEAGLVDQVTARGLFSEQLQQAQDGSSLIVLDPLPPS